MTQFKLSTSGYNYPEEDTEDLAKLGFVFEKEPNPYYRERTFRMEESFQTVDLEINTLEELIAFSDEWGPLVFDSPQIEIYDDYRE